MTEQELDAFLAKVRHTRLVDYLDPLGETAQNAFERRLSWARVTQHDPAYADEARFLLDHAEALREVLREELVQDDWVEDASAGSEFSGGAPVARRNLLTERERVTTVFGAEDLSDEAETTHANLARRAALGDPDDEPTTVGDPRETARAVARADRSLVSFDEDPDDVLTAVGPARSPEELGPDDVDPFDAPTTVGAPAVSRVAPPPPASEPEPEPEATADELSEYIEIDVLEEGGAADETVPPGTTPALASAMVTFEETIQHPSVLPSDLPTGPMVDFEETADAPKGAPNRAHNSLRRPPPPPPPPHLVGRTPAPAVGRTPAPAVSRTPAPALSRRPALDRPSLQGRVPQLRRPAAPPPSRGLWVGVAVAMLGFGFVSLAGAAVVFVVLRSPADESLTIERIDDAVADVTPDVPDEVEAPGNAFLDEDAVDPARARRPDPEPEPVRPPEPAATPDPEPAVPEPEPEPPASEPEPPASEPEPPVVAAAPTPEPPPAGSPSADLAQLEQQGDNDGVAAVEPTPERASPPAEVPPEPAPPVAEPPAGGTASPDPSPSPTAEPALVPPPDPAPSTEPEGAGEPPTAALDVTGLWIGAGDGRSFKLTIRSQEGPTFSGVVELKVEDGSWMQSPVNGRVDGNTIQFAEGPLAFRGSVSGGKRASGTYTTEAGGVDRAWTLIR
ncbi:MAG: hypothetical protein AAF602_08065 [Myxococcota bacterium]